VKPNQIELTARETIFHQIEIEAGLIQNPNCCKQVSIQICSNSKLQQPLQKGIEPKYKKGKED
jgi:hypothetical protein